MASQLPHRKQDLGFLFRCARAVETPDEAVQLHGHIERHIQASGEEKFSLNPIFLRILQGYVLHQAGSEEKARAAVDGSVALLEQDGIPSILTQSRLPNKIYVPALSLVSYAMRVCGAEPGAARRKVQHTLSMQLPERRFETTAEGVVGKFLAWSLKAFEATSAPDTLFEILKTPCGDVTGGSAHRVRVCVFTFLVLQSLDHSSPTANSLPRMHTTTPENCLLYTSVYDILFTLTIMMVGPPSTNFEHLSTSPSETISFARYGGSKLPQGRALLLLFVDTYASWTYPTQNSVARHGFMKEVCDRAWGVILTGTGKVRDEVKRDTPGTDMDEAWEVYTEMEDKTPKSTDPRTHLPSDSVESFRERIFDRSDPTSTLGVITAATSQPTTKGDTVPQDPDRKDAQQDMVMAVDERETLADHLHELTGVEDTGGYESDADTIYSLASQDSDKRNSYLQPFLDRFSSDCPDIFPAPGASGIRPEYLEQALKEFASRLHAESSNPFQWEAAVALHKARQ